jgi:hypothetical protein
LFAKYIVVHNSHAQGEYYTLAHFISLEFYSMIIKPKKHSDVAITIQNAHT